MRCKTKSSILHLSPGSHYENMKSPESHVQFLRAKDVQYGIFLTLHVFLYHPPCTTTTLMSPYQYIQHQMNMTTFITPLPIPPVAHPLPSPSLIPPINPYCNLVIPGILLCGLHYTSLLSISPSDEQHTNPLPHPVIHGSYFVSQRMPPVPNMTPKLPLLLPLP